MTKMMNLACKFRTIGSVSFRKDWSVCCFKAGYGVKISYNPSQGFHFCKTYPYYQRKREPKIKRSTSSEIFLFEYCFYNYCQQYGKIKKYCY